tara:strand:+ start:150 stop:1139 length:990 start_codon:yes stop_codon:yes gene_type:complete
MNKKIIFFTSTFNTSGAEKQLVKIFNALKEDNDCLFVTAKNSNQDGGQMVIGVKKTRNSFFQLVKVMKGFVPDIFISTLPTPNLLNVLIKKLRIVNYKSIVRVANYNIDLRFTKFILKNADVVLFNSRENLDLYKNRFPKINKKFYYLNNIIEDTKNVSFKENVSELNGVVVSRLTHNKGIDVLIRAMNELVDTKIKIDIYGVGQEYQKLSKLISNKNVLIKKESVNMENILTRYNFFVLPSRKEGMSNVLLEAQYNNLFSIVSDCKTGNKEIIELTENGVIFESENYQDLKDKLINFSMSKYDHNESRQIIIQNFSKNHALQILNKLI